MKCLGRRCWLANLEIALRNWKEKDNWQATTLRCALTEVRVDFQMARPSEKGSSRGSSVIDVLSCVPAD